MKFYTYETAPPADGLRADTPPLAPGTSWVQFGSETLYYTDAAPDDSSRRTRRARCASTLD